MLKSQLTVKQIQILTEYLKNHGFTKEIIYRGYGNKWDKFSDLLASGDFPVQRRSEVTLEHLFEILVQKIGPEQLISDLASYLNERYEKTISAGQAEAVLKIKMLYAYDSTARSHLHKLRKKLLKYQKFVHKFKEMSELNEVPLKIMLVGTDFDMQTSVIEVNTDKYLKSGTDNANIIGVELYHKPIFIQSIVYNLQIWNLNLIPRFEKLLPTYCTAAAGYIFCFKKNNQESLEKLHTIYLQIKDATEFRYQGNIKKDSFNSSIFVLGLGKSQKVSYEKARKFADRINASYFEFEDLNKEGVQGLLLDLTKRILLDSSEK